VSLLLAPLLLAWLVWRDAPALADAAVATGWLLHVVTTLRLVRATAGGAGAHAEWVRASAVRPRLRRSPAWPLGWALMLAGIGVALLA
jgi:hypothetical protein